MSLWVARHAPVAVEGVCYGRLDVPVRVDDETACTQLLEQLDARGLRLERVWASPSGRAAGPARCLARRLDVPLTVDGRLSELSFGEWEGRRYDELEGDPAFRAWMSDWERLAPPGGETLHDLLARVDDWHQEARRETALALTHAGPIRALRASSRAARYSAVVGDRVEALQLEAVE